MGRCLAPPQLLNSLDRAGKSEFGQGIQFKKSGRVHIISGLQFAIYQVGAVKDENRSAWLPDFSDGLK
ncbi:MAG: hypothetical protein M5U34_22690 [Chloroflexi bacterium]|nr:hypothetical protein [Chloroflexota bacterium]